MRRPPVRPARRDLLLLNYAEEAREVSPEGEWEDLFAGQVAESIRLGPADVGILKGPCQSVEGMLARARRRREADGEK
ncbi:MAG TPA: hypothetical protein VM366_00530 [Anaerolineae bacterium]|nr:hypothetical protein [Anaerolineae bacterium]